jgi:hypothetical protein
MDKKHVEKGEYFKYLGSMITSDARYTCKIKFKFIMLKATLNKKQALFTSELNLTL